MPTQTSIEAIAAILKGDPTVTPQTRSQFLVHLRKGRITETVSTEPKEPRLIRRQEAAHKLSMSLRGLDNLCKTGVLTKCVLPGRKRAIGISAEQVDSIIAGKQ